MRIPAVVAAGDRGAARAVYGESKVYLEIAGRPLVAWVLETLQRVPEVGEVWLVGDAARLRAVLARPEVAASLEKPVHVLEQFANLYENAWQSYRHLLPGAGAGGRDPADASDEDQQVLYLSGDLPFATAEEISAFVARSTELDSDYAVGLVTEESMAGFLPEGDAPGVRLATFNLREGRFRQSNLHLVRPARLGNRHYIEDMYENRHQRRLGSILALAWRLFNYEKGGLTVLWYYALMHVAGLADRRGWRGVADVMRRWVPMARVERGCSDLLRTRFRFAVTEIGGAAIDVDSEEEYDAAVARFDQWRRAQAERARALAASPALRAGGGDAG